MGVLLAVLALAACRPAPPITGSWRADYHIPGASLVLNLTQQDGDVTGTGTYAIEAGPVGTVSVTGTVKGDNVTLDLTYYSGSTVFRTGRFVGLIADATHLQGSVTFGGFPPSSLTLVRTAQGG